VSPVAIAAEPVDDDSGDDGRAPHAELAGHGYHTFTVVHVVPVVAAEYTRPVPRRIIRRQKIPAPSDAVPAY
jgi:hypothetical protein